MINQDKWISSLRKTNIKFDEKIIQVDHHRWENTIPKKDTFNTVKKYSFNTVKKYSLMTILFVCGLLFVSAVKNETRNLEKEINNLRASNNVIKFNLDQAILDNEVITSPENIARLAEEYLNTDFISYKKSQIKHIDEHTETFTKTKNAKMEKKNNSLKENIKLEITKKIEKKKTEIRKLQELYSNPESIPDEIKTQVAIKIEEKKNELKNLYSSPKETITLEKIQKWGAIQVVKVFLGMPIIPGK